MKILKTIHQFLPRHTAGSEIYTYHLCRELARRHEVHLFYPEFRTGSVPYSVQKGVYHGISYTEAARDDHGTDFKETYLNPRMDEVFGGVLEEFQPDLLHVQHLFHLSMNFIRTAKDRGVPVVMTLHEYGTQCAASGLRMRPDFGLCRKIDPGLCAKCLLASPFVDRGGKHPGRLKKAAQTAARMGRRIFEKSGGDLERKIPRDPALRQVLDRERVMREALAQVDHFIAPSRYLRDSFVEWGIPEAKITTLDYGFHVPQTPKEPRKRSGPVRFAFIGTPTPHKGTDLLIRAFNTLEHGRAVLKIYGDPGANPAYWQKLRSMASHPGIHFEGFLPPEKITRAYESIDALVVPSRWFENSPLTIHEALLHGVPVLTANLGGMKELIQDGVNGYLFEAGSEESLRKALTRHLQNPDFFDPQKLKESLPIQNFEEHAAAVEKIYDQVLRPSYVV